MGAARTQRRKKLRKGRGRQGRAPKSALPEMRRARTAPLEGDPARAVESLKRASRAEPRLIAPHIALARVQLDQDDITGAAATAERALRLDPNHGPAHEALSAAMVQRGRYDRALPSLERAAALVPQDAGTRASLGDCFVVLGRLDEGEAAYREALSSDTGCRAATVGLALVEEQRGASSEAAARLDPWVASGDRDSPMVAIWANSARRTGRYEEA